MFGCRARLLTSAFHLARWNLGLTRPMNWNKKQGCLGSSHTYASLQLNRENRRQLVAEEGWRKDVVRWPLCMFEIFFSLLHYCIAGSLQLSVEGTCRMRRSRTTATSKNAAHTWFYASGECGELTLLSFWLLLQMPCPALLDPTRRHNSFVTYK